MRYFQKRSNLIQDAGSSLSMAESMLFLDLAQLTVEAIECYNNYTVSS